MLALGEKPRGVVILRPDFLLKDSANPESAKLGKKLADDVIAKFEEEYLEVKCRKHVYLTKQDALDYFHYLPQAELQTTVAAFARGLCVVLVLEHLDGDVIDRTVAMMGTLTEEYGQGSIINSASAWACMRDMEFFFPHMDSLPRERTLAVIKSDGLQAGQRNKQTLEEMAESLAAAAGLIVVAKKVVEVSDAQATVLCKDLEGTEDHHPAKTLLRSEYGAVAMLLEGRGAVARWQLICGPTNSGAARDIAPSSLRAIWGTDSVSNAVHASMSLEAAEAEVAAFFPVDSLTLQRTLCMVKPDAMGSLMKIREEIVEAGFTVLIEKEVTLTEERAAEFYEAHAGQPYFNALVREATSGPCIVATLCRLEAVSVLHQVMGPETVKDARRLRPKSLRARYGRDGQRNAVHGSSAQAAPREVRFFFPELGADPAPAEADVQNYMFRKSATASMELKNISDADGSLTSADQTLQQLLSQGLMALCQVQPKGLSAVKWLSRWLSENNPNKTPADAAGLEFTPPQRATRYVETGITREGLPFSVEPPSPAKKRHVIDVDVSNEPADTRNTDLTTPPFVILAVGGPGSFVHEHCTKLKQEFSFVLFDIAELMNEEVAAETFMGTEIFKHQQQGSVVPDAIQLSVLKKNMVKHQDTNRFIIENFPTKVEQSKTFEQEIAEIAYILHFDAPAEALKARAEALHLSAEAIDEKIAAYEEAALPIIKYYAPIGKVRTVNAEKSADEAYSEAKRFVSCRFVYLLGPPGAPVTDIADKMEAKYGYSAISLLSLLQRYAQSGGQDADKVQQALSKGQAVDASIACPLLVAEICRDLALGIHNFVLCDFPQSNKQAEFLEKRLPCVTKPLLLDFSRADAEDLAATCPGDALQMELRSKEFFEGGYKTLYQPGPGMLAGLVRCPCSLSSVASAVGGPASDASRHTRIVEATWSQACKKIMPGLTIVLGPPCSGTERLAKHLAAQTPNTQAVDVNLMLDRELERRTEIGITMHSMLARGQVVPLSTSLDLLKDIVSLSGSDSIVIENLPLYVDQIEYISQEFRIDRVFYVSGTEKAMTSWKEAFVTQVKAEGEEDTSKAARTFDHRMERLTPIVSHFAKVGKLERIEVNDTPKDKKLLEEIKKATVPQFALVAAMTDTHAEKQAQMLASAYGVGPPVTPAMLREWCAGKFPARTVDVNSPREVFSAMKKYADATNYPFLVLQSYPAKQEDAAAFVEEFGSPKVVVNINQEDEAWKEEYNAAHAEDETPPGEEEVETYMQHKRAQLEGAFNLFKDKAPASAMLVQFKPPDVDPNFHETLVVDIKQKLRPKVFAIVAPQGTSEFSAAVADAICTTKRDGARPQKYTVVDCNELVKRGDGRHSSAIEDRLAKAMVCAEAPDRIPTSLWMDLFKEAFAQSNNPMGTFLVTNFPTPCCMTSNPSIPDQFHMLGQSANLCGTFCVRLNEVAFQKFCSMEPLDWTAYEAFDDRVCTQGKVQFERHQLMEVLVDGEAGLELTVAKLATEFHTFQTKAEHSA